MTLEFWRVKSLHYPITSHYRCPRCDGQYTISLTTGGYRDTVVHCDACKYEYREFIPTLLIDLCIIMLASVIMRLITFMLPSQWDYSIILLFFLLFIGVMVISVFVMDQIRFALMSSAGYQRLINHRIEKGHFKTKY